jgi:Fe-S cluster assembly protein SufB
MPRAEGARNHTQCDSLLIGGNCEANTYPVIDVRNASAVVEHEATASKVSEDQIFYMQSRGIGAEEAIKLIINGYCEEVFKQLPMEFAMEANRLLDLKLEGSVG